MTIAHTLLKTLEHSRILTLEHRYNRNDGDHLHKDRELAFTMKKVNEKEFNHGLGISREQIHTVRHKLRAAAYGTKGVNLSKEFARMDKNHDRVLTYTEFLHTVRRLTPLTDKQCEVLLYVVDENEDGLIDYEEVEKFVFSDEYPEILKRKREKKKTPSRGEEKMSRSDQLLKELSSLQSERSRLETENKSRRAKILRNKKTFSSQQKTNRDSSARRIPRETWQHRTRSPDKVAHAEKPPKSSRVSTRLLEDELIAAERDLHRTTKNLKGVSLSLSEKRMAIVEKSKELRVTNQQSELLLQIVREITRYIAMKRVADLTYDEERVEDVEPDYRDEMESDGLDAVVNALRQNDVLLDVETPQASSPSVRVVKQNDSASSAASTPLPRGDATLEEMSNMSEDELMRYFMAQSLGMS